MELKNNKASFEKKKMQKEAEKKEVDKKIKQIKKKYQNARDEKLKTEYMTETHFEEDMNNLPDVSFKELCLIGKSACQTVQKYQNFMFIEFDLKNSMTIRAITDKLREVKNKRNIGKQPIALFRNAQSYKEIDGLVELLASNNERDDTNKKHINLYLFEQNFDNMFAFKKNFQKFLIIITLSGFI